jgi:hypothetical protein
VSEESDAAIVIVGNIIPPDRLLNSLSSSLEREAKLVIDVDVEFAVQTGPLTR